MANRVYDDKKTSEEQLRDINGVNKADEKAMEARAHEPEELTEDLSEAEADNNTEQSEENDAAEREQSKLDSGQKEAKATSPANNFYKPNKMRGGRALRKAAFGVVVPLAILGVIVYALFTLASMKAIHFSTTLRAAGFASSQLMLRSAFSEAAYSNWALQNETVELPKSDLLDRLRGQDMRKVQQKLTNEGKFRYLPGADGEAIGVEVRGTDTLTFDDVAKSMGKENWNDLTFREKLTGRKYMTDAVKFGIADVNDMEVRGFRNGFWKGFREATGIKMTRFRDIFRDRLGNGTINEELNNDKTRLDTEVKEAMGERLATSENPRVEDGAEDINEEIRNKAAEGERISQAEARDAVLKNQGFDRAAFSDAMAKVSAAVFIATMYCLAHDMAQANDRINQQLELQLANFGHQQQTAKDQIVSGDVTSGDHSFTNAEWNGDGKTPEAAASPLYLADSGRDVPANVNVSQVPRASVSLPGIDILKSIDDTIIRSAAGGTQQGQALVTRGVDSSCGIVMNPVVQGTILLAQIVATFFSGGAAEAAAESLKAAITFAGFAAIGEVVQNYIDQMSGTAITGMEIGSNRYDAGHVGNSYLNAQTSRGTTYAAPETTAEAAATKESAMLDMRKQYDSGSFHERYLALNNPYSLLGLTVAKIPGTPAGLVTAVIRMGSMLGQPFRAMGSMFGAAKVHAADAKYNIDAANDFFGVKQWGWTLQEQAIMNDTNIVDNAAEVEAAVKANPTYYAELEKCYAPNRFLYQLATDPNCSADKLRAPAALKWRIYKLHSFAVNQLSTEGLYEQ